MPWKKVSVVSSRQEFVSLALAEGANVSGLCRRFNISQKTGYKWIGRFKREGERGLQDRSRRPHHNPYRISEKVEKEILALRDRHRGWAGFKIRNRLLTLGTSHVPSTSTITQILKRHGRIDPKESDKHKPYRRFEYPDPNDLWQMDFKGHFSLLTKGRRCHPLTVLDDHSRYALGYGPDDIVRKVQYNGELHFKGNIFHLSKALRGHPVGLRPTSTDGLFDVYLCYQKISTVDLNNL